MNTRTDVDGGGDDHGKKVAVVGNSPGKEKPRLNQSTTFLNIEGS